MAIFDWSTLNTNSLMFCVSSITRISSGCMRARAIWCSALQASTSCAL